MAVDLGRALNCAVLGVDQAEAAMWRAGVSPSGPTHHAAYLVVEALAADQLAIGHDVIIDAVNGPEPARAQWRDLAVRTGAELRFIVVECGDDGIFRDRVEHRTRTTSSSSRGVRCLVASRPASAHARTVFSMSPRILAAVTGRTVASSARASRVRARWRTPVAGGLVRPHGWERSTAGFQRLRATPSGPRVIAMTAGGSRAMRWPPSTTCARQPRRSADARTSRRASLRIAAWSRLSGLPGSDKRSRRRPGSQAAPPRWPPSHLPALKARQASPRTWR